MAGLGAAVALSRDGHRVTVLERDATPFPESPVEAFEAWDRRGAPQVRQSHAFLARLRNLLRERAPDLFDALLDAGAEEMPLASLWPPELEDRSPRPGDEELVMLACRRVTFEWVLRRTVLEATDVELRDGCHVLGLEEQPNAPAARPRVGGVRLRGPSGHDEVLAADWVIDASGRRSRLGPWLEALGARPPLETSEPCGIFYCSRFYRIRPGVSTPPRQAVIGADLGYLKYGIFHGDSRIFSLTFAASPEDAPMRALLRTEPFEVAAEAIPATRPWVDPAVAEPLGEAHGMARLANTRRRFVRDGEPLALGLAAIGDAAIHTNPLYGRGCTFALLHAWLLADALRAHPDDPRAAALALEQATEREIVPWYDLAVAQDRDAIGVARTLREGRRLAEANGSGPVDPKATLRDLVRRGLLPALRSDPVVLRAFLRSLNLLTSPGDLLRDPDVLQRVLATYQQRHGREEPSLGPERAEMIERLAAA